MSDASVTPPRGPGAVARAEPARPNVEPPPFELAADDRRALAEVMAQGSKSFAMASRLLPRRMRDAVLVYYAYCRRADDAIDESSDPIRALQTLRAELELIFGACPGPDLVSRELSRLVCGYKLSLPPFSGLLEGFAWDTQGRRYETLEEVEAYCARVAGTVGITMTELAGPRAPTILARAADLGVAMQLTNIARDVGTDARAGRIYLPCDWMREQGLDPQAWLNDPCFGPEIAQLVQRLLQRARELYDRCESGISVLPKDCQRSIYAARLIYADIGRSLHKLGMDSVNHRAYVRRSRKLWLMARAWLFPPRGSDRLGEPAVEAAAWLCDGPRQREPGQA